MSQTTQLIEETKRQLKLHGKNYRDIARVLELSEASVKRLFSQGNSLTLDRLERICQLMDMEMSELFALAASSDNRITSLTLEEERSIVSDPLLLLVTVCVFNGYRYQDITSQYQISDCQLVQKLAQLDRMQFIDLLPENKIKLKVSPQFQWLPGGPFHGFFQHKVKEEFFRSFFNKEGEKLCMATGLLSINASQKLLNKIDKLVSEFYDACKDDRQLPMDDRLGTSLIVAMRPWQFTQFGEMESEDSSA